MLPEQTLEALTNGRKDFIYNEDGMFMGASGAGMDLFVLHSLVRYLRLEIKTGMKMTAKASTLRKANEVLGTNYKRKAKALEHLEAVLVMAREIQNPRLKTGAQDE